MTDVAAESAGGTAAGAEDDEENGKKKESADALDIGHGATLGQSNPPGYGV
jgi:hypothetical protein